MNRQTLEQIRFIENILRTNEEKGQNIYYTIKIERYGEFTNVIDRAAGADVFLNDMEKTIKTHKPDQIIIELFSSKSKRIKYPTNTYKIGLEKGQNNSQVQIVKPNVNFAQEEPTAIKREEDIVPIRQYIQETIDNSRQQMQLEFNLRTLEFEIKQKDKEIQDLKEELEEKETELEEKEEIIEELGKSEAKGGLGSIALGSVGSTMLEKFITSKSGQALVSSFGGNIELLNGLLGSIKEEGNTKPATETKSTARVILKEENEANVNTSSSPNPKATIYVGKRLEDYNQEALINIRRVDSFSPEDRIKTISNILRKSDELYSMIFLQILNAINEEPMMSIDLQKFHLALVKGFNQKKKVNKEPLDKKPVSNGQNNENSETTDENDSNETDNDNPEENIV